VTYVTIPPRRSSWRRVKACSMREDGISDLPS
jgi:hypothetical protein